MQETLRARGILNTSPYPILTAAVVGREKGVVLSQAHYTDPRDFALSHSKPLPFVDIANYLPLDDYISMMGLGGMGRLIARSDTLHKIYNRMTRYLRNSLNLEKNLQATTDFFMDELATVKGRPITTFHYGVGNAAINYLLEKGIEDVPIVHYITDSYIHDNYLIHKDVPFVYYFVFDENTKTELIKKGVLPEKIKVTGFPLRLELIAHFDEKRLEKEYTYASGKRLRVGVFTGGLGNNQSEILSVAQNLDYNNQQAVFYCGVNMDLADKLMAFFRHKLHKENFNCLILTGKDDKVNLKDYAQADAIIIVDQELKDVAELSSKVIDWAQVVCTKPSGDIGIEALMSGKYMVLFKGWGEHERNIRKIIEATFRSGKLGNVKRQNIGSFLHELYSSGKMIAQIARLWERLRTNPPFPYDWRKRSLEALGEIEQTYHSRKKFATLSIDP